ncbi:MAG: hypothetical protein AAF456_17370 [Planctomycetota bacterium]
MLSCKRCGRRLTANNLDACPGCGPVPRTRTQQFLRSTGLFVLGVYEVLFLIGLLVVIIGAALWLGR